MLTSIATPHVHGDLVEARIRDQPRAGGVYLREEKLGHRVTIRILILAEYFLRGWIGDAGRGSAANHSRTS
jgi:hypothetical protein